VSNDHFVFRDHAGDTLSIVVTGNVVRYTFQDGSYLELDGGSRNLTRYDSASAFHEVISFEPHQINIWRTSAANLAILSKIKLHADSTVSHELHPDKGECNYVDGTIDCRPPTITAVSRPNLFAKTESMQAYTSAQNCSYEWGKVHKPYIGHETYIGCVGWQSLTYAVSIVAGVVACGVPPATLYTCVAGYTAFGLASAALDQRGYECRIAKEDADHALNECLSKPLYKPVFNGNVGGGYEPPPASGGGAGIIGHSDICYRKFEHSEGAYYIVVDCK
jgi:hypothetical protein